MYNHKLAFFFKKQKKCYVKKGKQTRAHNNQLQAENII